MLTMSLGHAAFCQFVKRKPGDNDAYQHSFVENAGKLRAEFYTSLQSTDLHNFHSGEGCCLRILYYAMDCTRESFTQQCVCKGRQSNFMAQKQNWVSSGRDTLQMLLMLSSAKNHFVYCLSDLTTSLLPCNVTCHIVVSSLSSIQIFFFFIEFQIYNFVFKGFVKKKYSFVLQKLIAEE